MSFPKAKRFTEHASQGPGPNAYDVVFTSSDRLVRDHLQFNSAQPNKPLFQKKFCSANNYDITMLMKNTQVASTPKVRFPEPLGRIDSQPRPLPSVVSRCVYYLQTCILQNILSFVIMQDCDWVFNTKEGVWKRCHHTQERSAEGHSEEDDTAQGTGKCYGSEGA